MKAFIVAILLLIFGIQMTYKAASELRTFSAAKSWPTVEGTVYGGEVKSVYTGGRRGRTLYRPAVRYRYEVDGKLHHCDQFILGDDGNTNIGEAQMVVNSLPADTPVTVHYDPESPENAYLTRGASSGIWLMILVGSAMAAVGVAVVRFQWRKFKSDDFRTPLHT